MKIRYLENSGFCLEQGDVLLVFDCWRFPPPGQGGMKQGYLSQEDLAGYEKIYVFVSHVHGDHFNPKIFDWASPRVRYVVDSAVPIPQGVCAEQLRSGERYEDETLRVLAHPSTDIGVSFQVELMGKVIFHAGDLNCWHWAGENTAQEEQQARMDFTRALEEIARHMGWADVAFFPVDPRLGTLLDDGALEFLAKFRVGLFIPMHFGQEFGAAERFAEKMRGRAQVWAPRFCGDVLEISC